MMRLGPLVLWLVMAIFVRDVVRHFVVRLMMVISTFMVLKCGHFSIVLRGKYVTRVLFVVKEVKVLVGARVMIFLIM